MFVRTIAPAARTIIRTGRGQSIRLFSDRKMSAVQIEALKAYSACDISDALLKLGVPGAGFLADIVPIPSAPQPPTQPPAEAVAFSSDAPSPTSQKVIAPASTVLFVAKSSDSFKDAAPPLAMLTNTFAGPDPNIPAGVPYSDLTTPETVVVVSQPRGQACAVVGGIMALRMAKLGAKGVVVDGRVRDLATLREAGVPIYSRGTSTIGAAAETKAWATQVPIAIGETTVAPGDVVMIDPEARAVVSIPYGVVDRVIEMLPKLVEADEKVLEEVRAGGEVGAAFKKYRGK